MEVREIRGLLLEGLSEKQKSWKSHSFVFGFSWVTFFDLKLRISSLLMDVRVLSKLPEAETGSFGSTSNTQSLALS